MEVVSDSEEPAESIYSPGELLTEITTVFIEVKSCFSTISTFAD